jgi:hypothetical protein
MTRSLTLVLLAVGTGLGGGAAPVPPEDEQAKLLRLYGTWVDPDGDCRCELTEGKLRISVPDNHHSINSDDFLMNAPRVWKEVEGDFTAEVRVTFPICPPPVPKASAGSSSGFRAGGLIAWSSAEEYTRVVRRDIALEGISRETFGWYFQVPAARHLDTDTGDPGQVSKCGYVRLSRAGTTWTAAKSRDGEQWEGYLMKHEGDWGKVKVGLVVENGYKVPFAAVFDQYRLTRSKK